MKMLRRTSCFISFLLLSCVAAPALSAQEPARPPAPAPLEQARAAQPPRPAIPLVVRLILSEYEGERKVTSLPYTFNITTNRPQTQIRLGFRIPIAVQTGNSSQITYHDVGTNIDCGAEVLPDSTYEVNLSIERSTVYSVRDNKPVDWSFGDPPFSSQPVFRTFRSSGRLVLREGQSMQVTWATDPVSGRVLRVEATLQSAR